jgi:hypothetical protein
LSRCINVEVNISQHETLRELILSVYFLMIFYSLDIAGINERYATTLYIDSIVFVKRIRVIWSCQQQYRSLKSETANQRSTDSTIAKGNRTKDIQRSTKHTHKTKDRATRNPLKTGGELGHPSCYC